MIPKKRSRQSMEPTVIAKEGSHLWWEMSVGRGCMDVCDSTWLRNRRRRKGIIDALRWNISMFDVWFSGVWFLERRGIWGKRRGMSVIKGRGEKRKEEGKLHLLLEEQGFGLVEKSFKNGWTVKSEVWSEHSFYVPFHQF